MLRVAYGLLLIQSSLAESSLEPDCESGLNLMQARATMTSVSSNSPSALYNLLQQAKPSLFEEIPHEDKEWVDEAELDKRFDTASIEKLMALGVVEPHVKEDRSLDLKYLVPTADAWRTVVTKQRALLHEAETRRAQAFERKEAEEQEREQREEEEEEQKALQEAKESQEPAKAQVQNLHERPEVKEFAQTTGPSSVGSLFVSVTNFVRKTFADASSEWVTRDMLLQSGGIRQTAEKQKPLVLWTEDLEMWNGSGPDVTSLSEGDSTPPIPA